VALLIRPRPSPRRPARPTPTCSARSAPSSTSSSAATAGGSRARCPVWQFTTGLPAARAPRHRRPAPRADRRRAPSAGLGAEPARCAGARAREWGGGRARTIPPWGGGSRWLRIGGAPGRSRSGCGGGLGWSGAWRAGRGMAGRGGATSRCSRGRGGLRRGHRPAPSRALVQQTRRHASCRAASSARTREPPERQGGLCGEARVMRWETSREYACGIAR
jgi:hypothetical protein